MREIKKYTINGETKTFAGFALKYNLPQYVLRYRYNNGWKYPDIFFPVERLGDKRVNHT